MKKLFCVILLCVLLINVFAATASAAGDALPTDSIRSLLNSIELHPQKTGYLELDTELERILAPYRDKDVYTQLKAAYDWTIYNIDFSWAPYSQNWAPAYDCFAVKHDLTYDECLQEVIPWEIANRSYHALTENEGVCYDYAATFAVMARYIGIDSYVHTGPFIFEEGFGTGSGHHGWVELDLGGTYYIFDSQRDYRLSYNGTAAIPYNYFGVPYENAWRYTQETEANAARDAQFVSVKADRMEYARIRTSASTSCTAEGGDLYPLGSEVTLVATAQQPFMGWFDESGALVCTDTTYTFIAERSLTLRAVCENEYFTDNSANAWFFGYANEAYDRGLINGTAPFVFDAEGTLTRAMALTLLARCAGDDGSSAEAGFVDVEPDRFYSSAVNWGVANGIVSGYDAEHFGPNDPITRQDFITMIVRYAASDAQGEDLPYDDADQISAYALSAMQIAQSIGLITGYTDNTVRPLSNLTRAEGAALLIRLIHYTET